MKIPKPYWQREDGWWASTTAIVMAVVAAASSAVSQYSAGQTRKATEKYNAQVAENNAIMTKQQAMADAQKVRDRGRRIIASQRTALAAAGVDIDSGSSANVQYDSAVQNELDALTTLYKGNVESSGSLAQAQLDTYSATKAGQGGTLAAGGTLLSGAASAIDSYSKIEDNPKFDISTTD